MKTLRFTNGDEMPCIGLGTWKSSPGDVYQAVVEAIRAGYRHIDCAYIYGNEPEVGAALKLCFSQGIVKREDLWITSKLWNSAHLKQDVVPALKQTLNSLGLDYLDLYLIHWPVALIPGTAFPKTAEEFLSPEQAPLSETWAGMEAGVQAGLTRHIGVSNFGIRKIMNLFRSAVIRPELVQIESHPFLIQQEMMKFAHAEQMHLTAYAPLGARDRSKKLEGEPDLLGCPLIGEIASQKDCSPAQILISWQLSRGWSTIPKSVNPERIRQNLAASSVILTEQEMESISRLNLNYRYYTGALWNIGGPAYQASALWD